MDIICKDTDCFVEGSWCYPYIVMVPINTIVSAVILQQMFGWQIWVCYAGIALLLALQIVVNKINALVYHKHMQRTDARLELLRNVIDGIRQIKVRCLESYFVERIREKRNEEISVFMTYCNIRIVSGSLYFNSGIILSTVLFLMVDRNMLELGKVFSTLSLLAYIFNFSILFSNYAVEALMSLNIFFSRVESSISKPFEQVS
jgi:ABC-type bacteriocin/lantibiotic exporter with double-glycine peptidase domain